MMDSDDTAASFIGAANTYVNSGLEVLIQGPDGSIRFPLCQEKIYLGSPAGRDENDILLTAPSVAPRQARFFFQGSQLFFQNLEPPGAEVAVAIGSPFPLGEYVLTVEREDPTLATLEGLSDQFLGRVWMLGSRTCDVGRPGRRDNQVALEHATVSRKQARILQLAQGFVVQAEADRSPTLCNGEAVPAGDSRPLADGDVLQFGEVRLRFRTRLEPKAGAELRVYCLGAFEVFRGSKKLSGTRWRHQFASFLLARLAAAAGKPVPTDRLLEDFWPEEDPDVSRRRLTWHISVLRGYLRDEESGGDDPGWLIRSPHSLCLDDSQCWHDVTRLRALLASLRSGSGELEKDLAEVLTLQRGPYLEGCYLEWAEQLRNQLGSEFQETARQMLGQLTRPPLRLELAQRLLSSDPCNQEAYVHAMQAQIQLGRPEEALKLFEQGRKALRRELNLDPSIDMLREQQRAKL